MQGFGEKLVLEGFVYQFLDNMEDRRATSKNNIKTARLTASAGKVTSRAPSCQNCGALKLSECSCPKMMHIASADKIPTQKPSNTLRPSSTANPNQTTRQTIKIPSGKPQPQKAKSVVQFQKALPEQKQTTKPLSLQDICLIHNKPLQVVCTVDLTVICSSCAIFGHKGHDFKSFSEFQSDKLKRCQDILELTDERKGMEEKIAGRQTKEKIQRRFRRLREQLLGEVAVRFRGLMEGVEEAERRCVAKINKSIIQQQTRISSLLSLPPTTTQSYKLWQVHAYDQIQAFQNDQQLPLQMKMLNYDKKLTQDIVRRGNTILSDMKNYYDQISSKIQQSLTSLSIVFDGEIEKRIERLPETVVKRRRCEEAEGFVFSSEDLLLEEEEQEGKKGKEKKIVVEDPILDESSVVENGGVGPELSMISHHQPRRKSLGEELSQICMQQPTGRDRTCSILPPSQISVQQLPGKSAFYAEQRSTLQTQTRKTQSICTQTQTQQVASSSMRKKINTVRCTEMEMTVSSILQPQQQQANTMRGLVSPDKASSIWPSLRSIVSPIDTRIKKVLTKLKLPQKYQKLVTGIMTESLQTLDLSNCSIDQTSVVCILQLLKINKSIKTVKLIRNRLTDDIVQRILPFLPNVTTLNLSQNYLTERCLDAMIASKMPAMRQVVVSQNRIREKTCKGKLEEMRGRGVVVTF